MDDLPRGPVRARARRETRWAGLRVLPHPRHATLLEATAPAAPRLALVAPLDLLPVPPAPRRASSSAPRDPWLEAYCLVLGTALLVGSTGAGAVARVSRRTGRRGRGTP